MLNPKRIIFDAVKTKLEGTGIVKLVLVFNVKTDKYNVMLSKEDNSSMKLDIEQDEITLVKKVLVNKIQKKYEQTSDKEINSIIVQMDIKNDDIKIFIEDTKKEVEQFNF